jgi:hypothetical protein
VIPGTVLLLLYINPKHNTNSTEGSPESGSKNAVPDISDTNEILLDPYAEEEPTVSAVAAVPIHKFLIVPFFALDDFSVFNILSTTL